MAPEPGPPAEIVDAFLHGVARSSREPAPAAAHPSAAVPPRCWIVVVLQSVQTSATLTLPTLNADIIDNGVLPGDNGYIWRIGAMMLALHARADRVRRHRRPLRRASGDGLRARRPPRPVPPGHRLLGPRGRHVRRAVAHHPHHQRRAAGPDARRDVLHDDGRGADHDGRSASILALREDVGLSVVLVVAIPVAVIVLGLVIVPHGARSSS